MRARLTRDDEGRKERKKKKKKKTPRQALPPPSKATDDRHCRRADAVGGIHGDDIGNVFIQSKASMIASAHS